ncbi:MAG: hypothetical protein EAY75_14695 [Bacteroidetes bacterium]|nr:MAG: hypothetical protein EAY75_14695 [Bacteroidota bacterium]
MKKMKNFYTFLAISLFIVSAACAIDIEPEHDAITSDADDISKTSVVVETPAVSKAPAKTLVVPEAPAKTLIAPEAPTKHSLHRKNLLL